MRARKFSKESDGTKTESLERLRYRINISKFFTSKDNWNEFINRFSGLHGPSLSGSILPVTQTLRSIVFIVIGAREEFALEEPGQGGGGTLGGGGGLFDGSNRGIFVGALGDDVARGHLLEINDVVCRHHAERLLDTEAKGTLEVLGYAAAQGPQAANHRAARWGTLPLEFSPHGDDGSLQVFVFFLHRYECDLEGFI